MSGSGFASNPAVKQYLKMAEVHGVDQLDCLTQAGIDPVLLEDNSGRVPIAALEQLLRLIIPLSKTPFLGYIRHIMCSTVPTVCWAISQ